MSNQKEANQAMLREPSFRWLLGGGAISMLGDQLTLITLPLLVLRMTSDTLVLGLVIALMGIPRAVFILFGGALVDRYSPKRVLMLTKYVNVLLLGALTALIFSGRLSLPVLYGLALGIGLASAFAIPAGTSILPQVVAPGQLAAANGSMMGLRQLTQLAGPLLAGLLVACFGREANGVRGLGWPFALDCASFALSAWTLAQVRTHATASSPTREPVLQAVAAGLKLVWQDRALRTTFAYWTLVSFCIGGVLQIAMPLLVSQRLHNAAALGVLMGVHGAGTLVGMALSGLRDKLRLASFGNMVLLIDALLGALLIPLGLIAAAWQGTVIMFVAGVLVGFMQIAVFTWIQQRVPRAMLGRIMSIFMFIFMGLSPASAAVAGWVMAYVTITQMYIGTGMGLMIIALLAYLFTPMRGITQAIPQAAADVA